MDFVCIEARLAIEIDGYWHAARRQKDEARTIYLEEQGFAVVRFNIEETTNVESLAEAIAHEASRRIRR